MKKLLFTCSLAIVILSSCAIQQKGVTSYNNDDVYANPAEDRIEEARITAEKRHKREVADKRYNDSIAALAKAQKELDDANPNYKEREFKYDDYYDYEYATRVKRFNNNISGLGYYDNYYTNSYWYNQNPYNYGVSVYNGYSWWGSSYNSYSYNPSINFYSSWGWGYGNQFNCYGGYNPYMSAYMQGYNNGFNNGMFGNYYGYGNPYGYASSFGFGNPYGYGSIYGYSGYHNAYNGWGYYNGYDNNSSYTYGPRTSHGGGNSRRTSNPTSVVKRESYADNYINAVTEQQNNSVKFAGLENPRKSSKIESVRDNNSGVPIGTGGIKNAPIRNNGETSPTRNNTEATPIRGNNQPIRTNNNDEHIINHPVRNNENVVPVKEPIRNPGKSDMPVKHNMDVSPRFETPVRQNNNESPKTPNRGAENSPSNNGARRPR